MATNSVSDEALARAANQMGAATLLQIEAAKEAQAEKAKRGVRVSLADVLIAQGLLTPALRENIERKLLAERQGGLRQLGNYKLLKKLGEGGMGTVYLAEDTAVGRKVAVKVLAKKYSEEPEFLTRFRREAQATGKLNHVNIVIAYNVGEEAGTHFYAMEYCEGETLDRILKRDKTVSWDKAVAAVMQVARGLKHAHEHGILHRDIKPANVFICAPLSPVGRGPSERSETGVRGREEATPSSGAEAPPSPHRGEGIFTEGFVAKILDLGLSKSIGGTEQSFFTQTGVALGTPHYISPEQAKGERNIDGRTDIYSLGATFYHLATGRTPFEGSTAAIVMMKHLNEQLTNPQDINADIPDGVAHVIVKMMAKEPNDRYRDCKELLDDLELVIDGKMPSSRAIDTGKSSVAMRRVSLSPAGRGSTRAQRVRGEGVGVGVAPSPGAKAPPSPHRGEGHARRAADEPELVPLEAPPNRKPLYIGAGVVALGAVVLSVALSMGGGRDKSGNQDVSTASIPSIPTTADAESAAKLDTEKQKFETDKRKAEEARMAAEAAAKKKAEEAAKTQVVTAPVTTTNLPPTTKVAPPPVQPDNKVTQPDTKAGEALTAQAAAEARAEKAQQLFNAVLKESAPLLAQNKLADAIVLLERKGKDPALTDAAELLKQEKADVEAVVELRKAAIEALRQHAGQQITLRKGGMEFRGKVVASAPLAPAGRGVGGEGVTLDMGGAQMTFNAMQLSLEDVDQYAPRTGNVGADLCQRGIMYLAVGNVAKAKECFTKAAVGRPSGSPRDPEDRATTYLDRITALEVGEIEAAALKAWEKAEKLFAAKYMKGAKAAYEGFERDHGQTATAKTRAATVRERYDAIEKVLGPAPTLMLNLGGGVKMELVLVKAGEFMMGSDDGEGCEKPVHKVKISKPFYLGKYEITVAQFRAFADATKFQTDAEKKNKGFTVKDGNMQEVSGVNWRNPGFKQEDGHPVVVVTWNDAQEFCKWTKKLAGRTVRLPTEAEWEYAARGPKSPKFPWGDKWEGIPANVADASLKAAGYSMDWGEIKEDDGFPYTSPVGHYKNSASWCGAFDMAGNAWQWCQDYFNDKYYAESTAIDPQGPANGEYRVLRGGCWCYGPGGCRCARRVQVNPGDRYAANGFRVVVGCGSSGTP